MERTGRHHHQHQVLASLGTEEAQARVRTAARALPLSPGERGVAPPTQQRAPVTVALGGLAPDALWLAHPDVAGGAWAVASVTRVQGHRAQSGAVESQGGVLHLAGGAAVHLCKDTVARSCTAGPCLASRCSDPSPLLPVQPVPGGRTGPQGLLRGFLPLPPQAPAGPCPALPWPRPGPLTCLAPVSCVPCLAVAGEVCAQVLAGAPIHARAPEAGGGGCKGAGTPLSITVPPRPLRSRGVLPLTPALPPDHGAVRSSLLPISQCRPEKPGGQSHLYLPM